MDLLKKGIVDCYPKDLKGGSSKEDESTLIKPIQMLHHIELMITEKCTEIDYIQDEKIPEWNTALHNEEKARRDQRQTAVKNQKEAEQ